MGEKYQSLKWISIQVLSIIPGLALGVHTSLKLFKPSTRNCKVWWIITGLYFLVAVGEIGFYIKAGLKTSFHQNSAVYTTSFEKAAHWWIYYFAVLVVTPSQIIALIYTFTPKEIPTKQMSATEHAELMLDQENKNKEILDESVQSVEERAHFMI